MEDERKIGSQDVVADSLDGYVNNFESDYSELSISGTEFEMDDQEKDDIIEAVGLDGFFFVEMDGSSPSSLVSEVRSLVKTQSGNFFNFEGHIIPYSYPFERGVEGFSEKVRPVIDGDRGVGPCLIHTPGVIKLLKDCDLISRPCVEDSSCPKAEVPVKN
ncbi:hypothetical protein L1049_023171 [Liquidambar formosana]|uniref:Uncharacterized protein n=1 Tax=Liquidambar formosana TaxID=63359 RepID=A0AAP0RF69_LIQFO